MSSMRYPVEKPEDWNKVGRLGPLDRLKVAFRNKRYAWAAKSWPGLALSPVRHQVRPLRSSEIALICVTRNTANSIVSFLGHYRRLGISRFAFVDDRSDDGTREILLEAPDVDLFESNFTYRQSGGGLIWRDMLVQRYGRDRWYVSVDSDEYLVYPGSERRPILDFISDIQQAGRKRALASMIDLYPAGPLGETAAHNPPEAPPTDFCPLMDGSGYRLANEKFCMAVRGGPRQRLFGTDMRLTKFPLVFADAETRFNGGSSHAPLPFRRNFGPVQSVLLHYKFPAGIVEEFRTIVARESHTGQSHFYKAILGSDGFGPSTDFRYPGSVAFGGSEALVAAGFMQDLRDPPSKTRL